MAMSRERFDALVARLEGFARAQPQGYRLRVGLLAAMGYVYTFLVLILVLALLVGLIAFMASGRVYGALVKIGWVLGTLAFIILRALWVRMPPPDGLPLQRAEVPRLFAMVDELTSKLQAPRFHHVLLTDDFNAAVAQVPRLGLFGWQRNYLLLGLPLMQALSPVQFQAVVAHELGHLSANHSRFAGWIYRVRQTWAQLLGRLEAEGHWGAIAFEWFLNWYVPFFQAYTFVLARADEYVADRCAAELAGTQNAAEALLQVELKGKFLEESFWPGIQKQVDQQPEPPASLFAAMLPALRGPLSPEEAARWLEQALSEKTSNDDTHPCLADRLSALGVPLPGRAADAPAVQPPTPPEEAAAQHFCGSAVESLAARLDQSWREGVAPHWRERHRQVQEMRQKLRELETKAESGPLNEEEAWNRARWTGELEGNEAAVPLLREFLAAHPEHAEANYALGQILLEQDDETGIAHLERAMEREPESVLPACQSIFAYLSRKGREAEAEAYRARAEQQWEQLARARQERSSVTERDRFEPHGLDPTVVERIRGQLASLERVAAAYLVRKVVATFPEKPLYVLAVAPRHGWAELQPYQVDQLLGQELANSMELPEETLILLLGETTGRLAKKLKKMPGAEIYQR